LVPTRRTLSLCWGGVRRRGPAFPRVASVGSIPPLRCRRSSRDSGFRQGLARTLTALAAPRPLTARYDGLIRSLVVRNTSASCNSGSIIHNAVASRTPVGVAHDASGCVARVSPHQHSHLRRHGLCCSTFRRRMADREQWRQQPCSRQHQRLAAVARIPRREED
jgi:hypothetical protein